MQIRRRSLVMSDHQQAKDFPQQRVVIEQVQFIKQYDFALIRLDSWCRLGRCSIKQKEPIDQGFERVTLTPANRLLKFDTLPLGRSVFR